MLFGPIKWFVGTLVLAGWTYLISCVPIGRTTMAEHLRRIVATDEARALSGEVGAAVQTGVLQPTGAAVRKQLASMVAEGGDEAIAKSQQD